MNDYYKFFHFTVTLGLECGLTHPVEWAINVHRTPGGTLSSDYYKKVNRYLPRYLVEIFKCFYLRCPENADEVLKMCDDHYPEGHMCKGYFSALKSEIEKYIKENKDGNISDRPRKNRK